jgi:hypothetical protein
MLNEDRGCMVATQIEPRGITERSCGTVPVAAMTTVMDLKRERAPSRSPQRA